MRFVRLVCYLPLLAVLLQAAPAVAQHAIEIQRKTAKGDYFEALTLYERMPKRTVTSAARVAAGKAAWALSLPARAVEEFDAVLRGSDITPSDRAKLLLSRGIIEYQEGRYQTAILFAEKLSALLDSPSTYRAKAWLLWAESLSKLNSYGAAEQKYEKALAESAEEDRAEIRYLLGVCELKLGDTVKSRAQFEQIPFENERAPQAIRALAQISLDEGRVNEAGFWLRKGRSEFPEEFLDAWVDYALIQVAIKENNREDVSVIQAEAAKKYPPSDYWLTLLNAAAEAYNWTATMEMAHANF